MVYMENYTSRSYDNGYVPYKDGEMMTEPNYYKNGVLHEGQLMNVYDYYVHGLPNLGFATYFAAGNHDGQCIYWEDGVCEAYERAVERIAEHLTIAPYKSRAQMFGLTGAEALAPELLQGDILVNLDSEDEGEIFIGCAGGVCNYAEFKHVWTNISGDMFYMKVDINGLTGGHSGDDISKGRANANKLLSRFLLNIAQKYEFYLCDISGGSLHNAIPRDASAVFAVQSADKESVRVDFNIFAAEVQDEYSVTEPSMRFTLQSTDAVANAIEPVVAHNILRSVCAVFNGVFAMSQDVPGLVETSSNLASIKRTADNVITVTTSQRSSIESARDFVSYSVRSAFELAGAKVTTKGQYPGWKPNMKSEILKVACDTYKQLFGEDAKIKAIHAGLECGLFLEKAPNLDMISFGPTMRGVHSPDERLDIASTERWWRHLLLLLEKAPLK